MIKGSLQQEDTKLLNLDVFYNTAHKYIRQKKGHIYKGKLRNLQLQKRFFNICLSVMMSQRDKIRKSVKGYTKLHQHN